MAIVAPVVDGELQYEYTDSSKKDTEALGSNLGYDQFLQLLCAEMQYQDPLEPSSNTDYVAQLATFSQVEATLNMAESQEEQMANNLVGKHVIIKDVNETTGKETYIDGKVDYILYKNGEIYLSVNDGLYPISALDTVADSDYYEAVTLSKTFAEMVSLLPSEENMQTIYKGAVEEVRAVYDSMTDYQKRFVKDSDLAALESAEARLKQLLAAEEANQAESSGAAGDSTEGNGGAEGSDGSGDAAGEGTV